MGSTARSWAAALSAMLTLAGLLVAAPPAHAAASPAAMHGTITDVDTGAAVAGACVALLLNPFEVERQACTDSAGRYAISDAVADVSYKMRVRAEGYADRWHANGVDYVSGSLVRVTAGDPGLFDLAIGRHAGVLGGRITRQDGGPAVRASVTVYPVGKAGYTQVVTRSDGEFRFDGLLAGSYKIAVSGAGYPTQWVPQTVQASAARYTVTAGAETVVHEQFLPQTPMPTMPVRTITGTVFSGGRPTPDACVTIYHLGSWHVAAVACTDAAGLYRANVSLGTFRILVRRPGDPDAWAPNARTVGDGVIYRVWSEGLLVTADAGVGDGPFGATIRGRISDYTGAPPPASLPARAIAVDGSWSVATTTAPDGTYEFVGLPAGGYILETTVERTYRGNGVVDIDQWFPQKRDPAEAEVVTVAAGDVLTRDETLVPPARVEVTLVDDMTGASVTTGCVWMAWATQCGDADGVYHFDEVWDVNSVSIEVFPAPFHFYESVDLPVSSGQISKVTLRLHPGAVLKTRMVSSADGTTPVTGCVRPVSVSPTAQLPAVRLSSGGAPHCADSAGNVLIGPLPTTSVHLLAEPVAPYGIQWVGATGGTGDRRLAKAFSTKVGATTTIPNIRVDRSGMAWGFVTDRANNRVGSVCVQPFGPHADLVTNRNPPRHTYCAQDGQYGLYGLGPYKWPLHFSAEGYADVWSGGAPDRFRATPVAVTSGLQTKYDIVLDAQGSIDVTVSSAGQSASWSATAYHPVTGDVLADATSGRPHLAGLNTGPLVIRFDPGNGSAPCWYYRSVPTGKLRNAVGTYLVNAVAGRTGTITITPGSGCVSTSPPFGNSGQKFSPRPAPATAIAVPARVAGQRRIG